MSHFFNLRNLLYVIVRSGKIIGGDIHSLELDGFMHGLTRNTEK